MVQMATSAKLHNHILQVCVKARFHRSSEGILKPVLISAKDTYVELCFGALFECFHGRA